MTRESEIQHSLSRWPDSLPTTSVHLPKDPACGYFTGYSHFFETWGLSHFHEIMMTLFKYEAIITDLE